MTEQEVMEALDKAGFDYDYIAGFDGSMRISIKFQPEEEEVDNG